MESLSLALSSTLDSALSLAQQQGRAYQCVVVALSGGLDSMLLLDQLSRLARLRPDWPAVHAVHIHHGLQPSADQWLDFCAEQTRRRHLTFYAEKVSVPRLPRQSLEAAARDARYQALFHYCRQQRGMLLLAHHQDDVLETLLLQLKRGAGPKGLAAMPVQQFRDDIQVLRPWLSFSRQQLSEIATAAQLDWIEDPSNQDLGYDRNFLRHQVVPLLKQRWPAIASTVARSARLCAEQEMLLQDVAAQRLSQCMNAQGQLSSRALAAESGTWQRYLLRLWLHTQGILQSSEAAILQLQQWLDCRADAQPLLELQKRQVRWWRQWFYVQEPVHWQWQPSSTHQRWQLQNSAYGNWQLWLEDSAGRAKYVCVNKLNPAAVTPCGQQRWSAWLKQHQVPPWQRDACLWVESDSALIAIILYDGTLITMTKDYRCHFLPTESPAI